MLHVRFALRSLAKAPLLSLVVVLSLGLGIGANTAIFSLLNQMLLSSAPVEKPEELALVATPGAPKSGSTSTDSAGGSDYVFSYRAFRELERQPQSVSALAAFRYTSTNLGYANQTVAGSVMYVSGGYFQVTKVRPIVGRPIAPADDQGAGNPVAVLSFNYWNKHLGREVKALNQTIRINGHAFTIVGVAPKGFYGTTLGNEPDAFIPLATKQLLQPTWKPDRHNDYWLYLLARVRPGATREQAAAALNGAYNSLVEEQVKTWTGGDGPGREQLRKSRLVFEDGRQGRSNVRTSGKTPIWILMAVTGMVLLIAIANAANLLLARSAQRRKELAIRTALGASRWEIAWQMLTEALILAAAGGLAGLAISRATLAALVAQVIESGAPPGLLSPEIDLKLLLYAFALALVTGLLFGLYPAWEASRPGPGRALNEDTGHGSEGRSGTRVRRLLVWAQVTISTILLIPTGMFLKSLVNLMNVDVGIRTENVLALTLVPEMNGYNFDQCRALLERAEEEFAAIPGVTSVAAGMVPILGGSSWVNTLTIEAFQGGAGVDTNSRLNEISPGYFGKMGIPLIAGREFTWRDNRGGPKVAVVNEQFVKDFFGGRNPIGKKFTPGLGQVVTDIEIVGVVKDTHYANLREKRPRVYYTPWRQNESPGMLTFYLRSPSGTDQVAQQLRASLRSIDPDLPAMNMRTLDDQVKRNAFDDRLMFQLSGAFAGVATALAMLGLYGVMAHSVTRRTREIGIRMALGAAPGSIRRMVMADVMLVLSGGILVGVPTALALTGLAESRLFGVEPRDPAVVAAAVAALTLAAFAAGYLPARRAARVNPLDSLRHE